jgi:hypothetical protein
VESPVGFATKVIATTLTANLVGVAIFLLAEKRQRARNEIKRDSLV